MPFEGGAGGGSGGAGLPIYGSSGAAATAAATAAAANPAGAGVSAGDTPATSFTGVAAEQGKAAILETTTVPTASAPLQGLPANPKVGGLYIFRGKPDTVYIYLPSNVWGAIVPIQVV